MIEWQYRRYMPPSLFGPKNPQLPVLPTCAAEDPTATLVSNNRAENDFVLPAVQHGPLYSGSDVLWTDLTINITGAVSPGF